MPTQRSNRSFSLDSHNETSTHHRFDLKSKNHPEIPSHDLESMHDPIQVHRIDHKNHYDYTQQHRHRYFEIMFFLQGGGKNLIDFIDYEVKSNACYLIYPGQIHLLNRAPGSHGYVIQFQLSAIASLQLQRLLQEKAWSGLGAVFFEEHEPSMHSAMQIVEMIRDSVQSKSLYRRETQQHLLQALLFDLFSVRDAKTEVKPLDFDFYLFLQLIDVHFKENQNVGFYLERLNISEKKLALLSQKYLGLSPLQIIHQRVLLEAKRLLVTGQQPHKEIAYDLGFDSPASFSAFIKKKTGHTASEIQVQMTEIHKQ
jgi:AraC family transcriptional regulator, transcriptional activator of pobA